MNKLTILYTSLFVSLFAVQWIFLRILKIAKVKGLVDKPNARKLQKTPVPVLGGIAVFFGLLMGMLTYSSLCYGTKIEGINEVFPVIIGASIMLYVGSLDDIMGLTPITRIFIEVTVMLGLIFGSGICVDSLQGLWDIREFSWWIAVPLTVFAGVGLINAYNMVDGVNGLSSGLCVSSSILMCVICYKRQDNVDSALAGCYAACLLPFLMHNIFGKRSRMFIGDGGTMVMGLLVSWYVIRLLSGDDTRTFSSLSEDSRLGLVPMMLAVASVPVFDTLRVMTTRMLHGSSPFKADKTHLHHAFIQIGVSHLITSVTEIIINLLVVGIWYLVYKTGAEMDIQLYTVIISSIILIWGAYFLLKTVAQRYADPADFKWTKKTHFGNKRWWLAMQQWLDKGAYEDYYIINRDKYNKKPEELSQKEKDTVEIVNYLQGKSKVSIEDLLQDCNIPAEQVQSIIDELTSSKIIEILRRNKKGEIESIKICRNI